MIIAKVVKTTDNVHASHQGLGTVCQGTRFANQMIQALAKGCIEPFDESCIDHPFPVLGSFDQAFHHFLAALHNAPINRQHTFDTLFHHLHNGDV